MAAILTIQNLTKQFGGLTAVNDLSMTVEQGSIHALIGPNGSGKTTTTNMIEGVFPPTSGRIFFKDTEITNLQTFEIARCGIGRTFQNIKLYHSMTAIENVMVGGHQLTKLGLMGSLIQFRQAAAEERMLREKAEAALEYVGLIGTRNEVVKNLPYGKRKVLEVARMLMTDPELVLLDEPAAGLNPSERSEFIRLLIRIHESGKTLFFIEHNMDVVMNISQKITVINFGAKIAEGTTTEIQNDPEVIKAYLGDRYRVKRI
ncbi:MAG TPA: ABC transporter ATP-binding protein [Pseudoflavonifractor sp.]|nr:ABC transporter ATP-binding protein [Pseudoflavonifractor sp.]